MAEGVSQGRAIGYRRLSPGERRGEGLGLEAQQRAIAGAAKRLGLPVARTFTDENVSGGDKIEACPALLEAVGELGKGDVLIVAKRDRLARDPIKAAMLERLVQRRGARILSAAGEGTDDDEASSILMRRIIDAFAEYERLLISARTKAALRVKRARGERTGGVPYGWREGPDGKLLTVEAEQRVRAWLKRARAGGASLRELCRELTERGVKTKNGGHWHPETVRSILALRPPGSASRARGG